MVPAVLISASFHRSGSTWLQRVLHAASDVFVWGENNELIPLLRRLTESWPDQRTSEAATLREFLRSGQSGDVWVANIRPEREHLVAELRSFVENLYSQRHGRTRWGWKAVTYGRREVEFVRELFPDVPVILMVRNIVDVYLSLREREWLHYWSRGLEEICEEWAARALEYWAMRKQHASLFVRYEDVTGRWPEILKVVDGAWTPEAARAAATFVSETPRARLTAAEADIIRRCCREALEQLGYDTDALLAARSK